MEMHHCARQGRGWGDEGASRAQSIHKERGRKWPSQWPLPISFQCGLNQIQHSMMGLILDSSLSKQAILQAIGYVNTPFLSYLALMQLSWYCNMVWTWDMLDTALPIIGTLCGTEAGQQHWKWMNKYSTVTCWSPPSCYLVGWHWEQYAA